MVINNNGKITVESHNLDRWIKHFDRIQSAMLSYYRALASGEDEPEAMRTAFDRIQREIGLAGDGGLYRIDDFYTHPKNAGLCVKTPDGWKPTEKHPFHHVDKLIDNGDDTTTDTVTGLRWTDDRLRLDGVIMGMVDLN